MWPGSSGNNEFQLDTSIEGPCRTDSVLELLILSHANLTYEVRKRKNPSFSLQSAVMTSSGGGDHALQPPPPPPPPARGEH